MSVNTINSSKRWFQPLYCIGCGFSHQLPIQGKKKAKPHQNFGFDMLCTLLTLL